MSLSTIIILHGGYIYMNVQDTVSFVRHAAAFIDTDLNAYSPRTFFCFFSVQE